jgi:hypothetical protein
MQCCIVMPRTSEECTPGTRATHDDCAIRCLILNSKREFCISDVENGHQKRGQLTVYMAPMFSLITRLPLIHALF